MEHSSELGTVPPPTPWTVIREFLRIAKTRGRHLIYYPRRYDSHPDYAKWRQLVRPIEYRAAGAAMRAFLHVGPTASVLPERLWLLIGGNGSVALDWIPLLTQMGPSANGFILFDYPGFGDCGGAPSRRSIAESMDRLIDAAADSFSCDPGHLVARLGLLGHSLGAAVALETACRHRTERVLLLSPFTSIRDMARRITGAPLHLLATDPFDNRTALKKLLRLHPGAEVTIAHGNRDEVIPIDMARQLRSLDPQRVILREIPEANHNDIVSLLAEPLALVLAGKENSLRGGASAT